MLSDSRWQALAAAGARPQRPLWASTSTKDPTYLDTRYVVELIAPGVINTMPEATLLAVADHGDVPADSIRDHYQPSARILARLEALGIDVEQALQKLEDDGLSNFDDAWTQLAEQLTSTLHARSAATAGYVK
jgi:transaldolase